MYIITKRFERLQFKRKEKFGRTNSIIAGFLSSFDGLARSRTKTEDINAYGLVYTTGENTLAKSDAYMLYILPETSFTLIGSELKA